MKRLHLLWRALVLLAVVGLAVFRLHEVYLLSKQHKVLAAEVADLATRDAELKSALSQTDEERRHIAADKERQAGLYQEKLGYVKEDEAPIVVEIQ